MSILRILSIGLALLALGMLALDWLGIIARVDRVIIIFPILLVAIILKYVDAFIKKKNNT